MEWQDGQCAGEVKGEERYAYAPGRSSAVFLFGYMGLWNRDRDCEPAQLTVAARMGKIGKLGLDAGSRAAAKKAPRERG